LPYNIKQGYVNLLPASFFSCQNYDFCRSTTPKKMFKITYLVTISVNKKATIESPHTNFISLDVSRHNKSEHMDPIFVSLFSLPKVLLLLKTAMKP
jgi:hypothetical protein